MHKHMRIVIEGEHQLEPHAVDEVKRRVEVVVGELRTMGIDCRAAVNLDSDIAFGDAPDFASDQAAEAWIKAGRPQLPEKPSGKTGYTVADVRGAE